MIDSSENNIIVIRSMNAKPKMEKWDGRPVDKCLGRCFGTKDGFPASETGRHRKREDRCLPTDHST
jgi:hypothetical protein